MAEGPEDLSDLRAQLLAADASADPSVAGVGRASINAQSHFRAISIWLAVSDVVVLVTALVLSWFLRFGIIRLPIDYLLLVVVAPLVWVVVFQSVGLYRPQHLGPEEEFRRVVNAVSTGILFLVLVSFWSKSSFSRSWIAVTWVLALILELAVRRTWRAYIEEQKQSGRLSLRSFVVGAEQDAFELASRLRDRSLGFHLIGLVSLGQISRDLSTDDLKILGSTDELDALIDAHQIECVFIPPSVTPLETGPIVRVARRAGVEVRIAASIPELLTSRVTVQALGGAMTLSLLPPRLNRFQAAVKRAFDVLVATVVGIITAPLLAVTALAIRLSSRGPVLFVQERITRGGQRFKMYKFRTMTHGAAEVLDDLGVDASQPFFKMGPNDPRLTRVGKLIRRWSLDELPQLINVLKGEMSLVGPRPLPADQVAANLELLGPRHEVPAGITGWWQIRGRSELDSYEAVRMDLFYVENWSLSLDMYILLKTLGTVLARRGAF